MGGLAKIERGFYAADSTLALLQSCQGAWSFASLTLACFAQKLLGSNFEEGRQAWLPLPAMHTRLRRAIVRFEWSRVAWSPWTWRKAGSHARSFFGVGHRA